MKEHFIAKHQKEYETSKYANEGNSLNLNKVSFDSAVKISNKMDDMENMKNIKIDINDNDFDDLLGFENMNDNQLFKEFEKMLFGGGITGSGKIPKTARAKGGKKGR